MKNKNLLIEIYVEEFPVKFLEIILTQMPDIVRDVLLENKIIFNKVNIFVTPVRIVIYVEEVNELTKKEEIEILGPNINIGLKNGEFTNAGKGFAKKNGVELDKVYIKQTSKGNFLAIKKILGGKPVKTVLPEVVKTILSKNIFPKTMVWEETKFKFPRPIRNILIFFGNEIIKTVLCGIKTSDTTFGIKTYPIKKIKIKNTSLKPCSENYFDTMENENILINHNKRLETLKKMLDNITSKNNLTYDKDENLLKEINMLIEYPSCVMCEFPQHFLTLPKEVVTICMKTKQKFIPLFDRQGNLVNKFIGIKNGYSEHLENVKNGYEKVLIARLNDAKFFYETDLKTSFVNRTELLKGIIYNIKLGTLYEKVLRIKFLAQYLNQKLNFNFEEDVLEKTAKIIKNDVTTLIVQEYPELQGIMGKIYSFSQDIEKQISTVCEQHYLPKQFDDNPPKEKLSILFAISTKLSDLIDNIYIDNLPTGTSDPFGLKKVADSVIKIFVEYQIDLQLKDLLKKYLEQFNVVDIEKYFLNLKTFFKQRLENIYVSKGYKIDEIRAILSNFDGEFWSKTKCIEYINKIRTGKEFLELIEIYKRVNNILRQGKQKYNTIEDKEIEKSLLKLDEEKVLVEKLFVSQLEIEKFYQQKDFKNVVEEIIKLRSLINNFFDKVLVFDSDEQIAFNRILIVNKIHKLFNYYIGQLDLIQQ
jgi:glycyl-tRNA synthetase beta chain